MDVEKLTYSALSSDAALIVLLGASSVYNSIADDATVFPRIVFEKYLEGDSDYADDKEQAQKEYVQLDIINQGDDVEDIAKEAESAMLSAGFCHVTSRKEGSMNDQSKIIEKHMQFVMYVEETED